jgi:hypothetical protein
MLAGGRGDGGRRGQVLYRPREIRSGRRLEMRNLIIAAAVAWLGAILLAGEAVARYIGGGD